MSKLTQEAVVAAALELLDEVGLDAISTHQLAKRLGVEQPSLYWHFRNKRELLAAMADMAMRPHAAVPLPEPSEDWRTWLLENNRSFRQALLAHRDGARLHGGSLPEAGDIERIKHKLAFLVTAGVPEHDAQMAMFATSHFTVGSVLEEQAAISQDRPPGMMPPDPETAFEEGIALILDGLATRLRR
jgi:TetR/AcrR family tetracycline transcriptional repressor